MKFTYDSPDINWARLCERVIASTVNALVYGLLLVLAKLLGIL